jgi:formyl-CoA transferase
MDEVDRIVSEWTAGHPKQDLFELLGTVGVPAAPVLSLAEVVKDPQVRAQGMLQEVEVSGGRREVTFGSPLRLGASPPVPVSPAPGIGSDSKQLLVEKLGLSAAEIEELSDAGVI